MLSIIHGERILNPSIKFVQKCLQPCLLLTCIIAVDARASLYSTSFNCASASTETEKIICQDPQLASLDRQVSKDYNQLADDMKKAGNYHEALDYLNTSQEKWKKETIECKGDSFCIQDAYGRRLSELTSCYHKDSGVTNTQDLATSAAVCVSAYKMDWSFLSVSEGGVWVEGYVPGYHREDPHNPGHINKKKHGFAPDSHSGVTIGNGVDLAQQTPTQLRHDFKAYVEANGNPDHIDYEEIITNLSPYMNKKITGWKAVEIVTKNSPSLSKEEADFLTQAVQLRSVRQLEAQFNRNNQMGTTFQQLPAEAQTALVDFSYQYGHGDSLNKAENKKTAQDKTRNAVWSAYYQGDWQTLSTSLQEFTIPDQRKKFKKRRHREGILLQKAIGEKRLPGKGNPCPPSIPKPSAALNKIFDTRVTTRRTLWS